MKKILIVDDEIKIIDVVKSYLESKGFFVLTAENGRQALDIIEKQDVSLILLDLMLPDISGEEVCSVVRRRSRVPIIMITAKVEESDLLQGLGIGADDYVTKPFSLKALHARIEAVMRRSADDPTPLFSRSTWNKGDLEIDFLSFSVKKNHVPIILTPNEFSLLSTLVKYPNKVFTREELIAKAFGEDYEGYDRIIDTHIKNIRHKIESNPKTPIYILTIHGVGYQFGGGRAS
jgi:DNA-binding response OmpR family regulator